ncbi:MAG: putative ABC transporter permease [Clostridia bacterium]|nr:putative ABC transporter permease [Clostridia bacterium]
MISWIGCFFIYSFFGCVLETVFCFVFNFKIESRKCMLLSALCPVYGLGGIAVSALSFPFKDNKIITFFIGMIAATLVEYIMDMFYKDFLGVSFWNYSQRPLNINGRVWIVYSICWGLLSLLLVYKIHPAVWSFVTEIPSSAIVSFGIFFAVDMVLSSILMYHFQTKDAINLSWIYHKLIS